VEYKSSVAKDLKKMGRKSAKRIIGELEKTLSADPDRGVPLKGRFKGLLKYRVGDYRVIYARTEDGVLVLRIGHRRGVYK
jgi:mRNA interferase RelE/StbE